MSRNRAAGAALVVILLIFGVGVVRLLRLRYARGDIYPHYSSLRADPLGARILHDALADSGAVAVRRNLAAWPRLEGGAGTTVLILGVPAVMGDDPVLIGFAQRLALRGSRVVVGLAPETERPDPERPEPETTENRDDAKAPESSDDEVGGAPARRERVRVEPIRRWGFELDRPRPEGEDGGGIDPPLVAFRTGGDPLPVSIPWWSVVTFSEVREPWEVRYAVAGRPVVLERTFGAGSLVVLTDTYLLSNEAMRGDRQTALLAWLVGPARSVVFEERIHGIEESETIATLLRRYGLAAPGLALLVLAALALWYAGSPLLPRRDPRTTDDAAVPGRDSAAGLVTLLRRAVRPPDLIRLCIEEWARSGGSGRAADTGRIRVLTPDPRDPLGEYRRIHRLVNPTEGDHDR